MLISKLVEYAKNPGIADADPYFETKPVRWHVVITPEGRFVQLLQLGDGKRGIDRTVPKKVGANKGGVATFGTDNPRFVLGHATNEADRVKAARDLPAFVALIERAAAAYPEVREFQAAARFYASPAEIEAARIEAETSDVKSGDRLAIAVTSGAGVALFETPEGRSFWRGYREEQESLKEQLNEALCLSCGQLSPPVSTGEKIVGVPGGQPSGTSLVSFDKDAFASHGWSQNANAAMCSSCSQTFTRGLNHLLRRSNTPRTRIDQAGVAFEFWLRSGSAGDFVDSFLEAPHLEEAAEVLDAARRGQLPTAAPGDRLYALGLRGNGGRAVVVDWFDETLDRVYGNLGRWFDDLEVRLLFDEKEKGTIFRKAGELSRPPRLWVLCMATARQEKEISARTPAAILRAALRGGQLPLYIAEACVRRLPLDGFGDFFAPARIGLIRCTLNRRNPGGRKLMPGLDPDNDDAAYLCGRLISTLEAVQFAGVGDVGANIIDRFYGKASTAPALVFGQLMTLAQSHLGAINNDGQRINFDREISDIISRLGSELPRTLTLEEQGRFAVGYYHQKAYHFAEIRRRRDERAQSLGRTLSEIEE